MTIECWIPRPLPILTRKSGRGDAGGGARGDVFLVSLDPVQGGEIQKTRPCVVVSPDELNAHLRAFIVAPLTTGGHPYPFRVPCGFKAARAMW